MSYEDDQDDIVESAMEITSLKAEVGRLDEELTSRKLDEERLRNCLLEAEDKASFPVPEGLTLGACCALLIRDALENAPNPEWVIRAHWAIIEEGDFDVCVKRRDGTTVADVVGGLRSRAEQAERERDEALESCALYQGHIEAERKDVATLTRERDEAKDLVDLLKQEAQIHAQEARTHKGTVHRIYQYITGANGEPGDWHGEQPIVDYVTGLKDENETLTRALEVGDRLGLIAIHEHNKHDYDKPFTGQAFRNLWTFINDRARAAATREGGGRDHG